MTIKKWLGIELVEFSVAEKLISACGGALAIFLLLSFSYRVLPQSAATAVVGSMGATAVLLFAVPHGPLSQPWAVLAGNCISAAIGVTCAQQIADPVTAAACAVGLSIGAMHQFKCIHPPGGATAFIAVMGGTAVRELGYRFVLLPVLLNAATMVIVAVLYNGPFPRRRYPVILSRRKPPSPATDESATPTHDEIMAALRSIDSFVDVGEDDLRELAQLLRRRSSSNGRAARG